MTDVRKLLQAERRLRETAKPKFNPPAAATPPNSHASIKRSLPGTDETAATKRQKTSTDPIVAGLPVGFFDDEGEEGAVAAAGANKDGALKASKGGDNPSPHYGGRGGADVEKDDASMAGASDANANPSTLPSDFFEAKSSIPSSARVEVDEAEWAAFQADVVEPARPMTASVTVIEAAPTINNPAASLDEQDTVDGYAKGEEEDAKQKLLDEFEEMEGLEQRVLRLKERREALKTKAPGATKMEAIEAELGDQNTEEDEDDEEEDDFFRARGS